MCAVTRKFPGGVRAFGLEHRQYQFIGRGADAMSIIRRSIRSSSFDVQTKDPFLTDPAMVGIPIFDKKSLLINKHLDKMGMGRYQWFLYFLCGGGYFLDLMWANSFGLAGPAMQREFGIHDNVYGTLFTSFSVGLTVGALVWGILVDIIGRKWAFNLTLAIASVFGTLIGIPYHISGTAADLKQWQWVIICILAGMVGTGIGGNIPIDSTILIEFLPQNKRFLLASVSTFQPLGVVMNCLISYLIIPKFSCPKKSLACNSFEETDCCTQSSNMGWRYMFFATGAITIVIFIGRFLLFKFIESPKFLLSKGRDEEAIQAVQDVAKVNRQECHLSIMDFYYLEVMAEREEAVLSTERELTPLMRIPRKEKALRGALKNLSELFSSWTMVRLTLLTWVVYAFDAWGFSIAGAFGPKILESRGQQQADGNYLDLIIVALYGLPGTVIATTMIEVPSFGRKWSMVFSSALMATSCFLFVKIPQPVTMLGLEYFAQSLFNAILYGWTAEAFPARLRGTACGLASTWGRLFSIISPILAGVILASRGPSDLLYLAGGGVFICTAAIVLLPETKDAQAL
ncbi:hypothetical protein PROFUN_15739 [Planoprotostelium fungivorum]|uniref:Major facilitator superfamily (MFS) profile domain-containing protein n=1 Tax=Planoprotostelium fungivorum TaxID=1890364 RepID=A0A2P6MUU0_9EUKA|nr:hypothetical protein PROFUN_15739 [Planoprotostelium fungivorum]